MKHVKKFIKKNQFVIIIFALCLASASLANSPIISAVTYQTGVGVNFTLNPKLTLSLSSANLLIPELAPGTSGNSNEITITVSTNAAYGYNLSASVGNNTAYNNRDLTHTAGATSGKFQSIAFQADLANYISSFTTDNTWGYSIDSGTKYNGLPLYSDTTNIATLKATDSTPTTGTDTVNFLIGAKAAVTQPTGDYENVINFMAVSNPVPMSLEQSYAAANKTKYNGYYKMQDMDSSICAAAELEDDILQVIDVRDNEIYKISKLKDGRCWMLDNLAIDPTDSNIASNINETNTNASATAIYNLLNGGSTTPGWSKTAISKSAMYFSRCGYNAPCINVRDKNNLATSYGPASIGGQAKIGIYYNFCAASVGTYCYAENISGDIADTTIDATQDICPVNWRMPTGGSESEFSGLSQYYNNEDASSENSLQYNLSAVLSGILYDTVSSKNTNGYLWSSTQHAQPDMMYVSIISQTSFIPHASFGRNFGVPIRCIAK